VNFLLFSDPRLEDASTSLAALQIASALRAGRGSLFDRPGSVFAFCFLSPRRLIENPVPRNLLYLLRILDESRAPSDACIE